MRHAPIQQKGSNLFRERSEEKTLRRAGSDHSFCALHVETRESGNDFFLTLRHCGRFRRVEVRPRRGARVHRVHRIPPRRSADRLSRTSGTSTPPEIASQSGNRRPALIARSSSRETKTCPAGTETIGDATSNSPPHHAITRSSANRIRKFPSATSITACFSLLPTRKFAIRAANGSSAPLVPTPIARCPKRPSPEFVNGPARRTCAVIRLTSRIQQRVTTKTNVIACRKSAGGSRGHQTFAAACDQ